MDTNSKTKFQELFSKNVNEYVEQKNGLNYLSWAYAWAEFKKMYPEANYEIRKDENGKCYFGDGDIGYMVYTRVVADELTHEMWLPVMDGANKAMKDKPYQYTVKNPKFKYAKLNNADGKYYDNYGNEQTEYLTKNCEAMTMFDVNKTIMRCLVKNLAMFGLGLYIYAGEDLPEDITEYTCSECGKRIDKNMAERTEKAFSKVLCKDCGLKRSKAKETETGEENA